MRGNDRGSGPNERGHRSACVPRVREGLGQLNRKDCGMLALNPSGLMPHYSKNTVLDPTRVYRFVWCRPFLHQMPLALRNALPCGIVPACLQGTIFLGRAGSRLKWKTNSNEGARRPFQSPGRPGPWSQTYQPNRRQPCIRIHSIHSSQYGHHSPLRWTSPRFTKTCPSSRIGSELKPPVIRLSQLSRVTAVAPLLKVGRRCETHRSLFAGHEPAHICRARAVAAEQSVLAVD